MKRIFVAACAITLAGLGNATEPLEAGSAPAATAQSEWRGTKASAAQGETLCIGNCNKKDFLISGHKTVQADLWAKSALGEVCSDALNGGLYKQDLGEFYKAEAHFDNCAASESLDYLQKLKSSGDEIMRKARASYRQDRGQQRLRRDVRAAMKEYGRALHIVQDFYAHTNYVDLMADEDKAGASPALQVLRKNSVAFSENLALQIWTPEGVSAVLALQKDVGLVSGTVSYEASRLNRCAAGSPTHEALSKDAPNEGNGAKATRWAGVSRYQAATTLAKASTRSFILEITNTWPEIEGACGKYLRVLQLKTD